MDVFRVAPRKPLLWAFSVEMRSRRSCRKKSLCCLVHYAIHCELRLLIVKSDLMLLLHWDMANYYSFWNVRGGGGRQTDRQTYTQTERERGKTLEGWVSIKNNRIALGQITRVFANVLLLWHLRNIDWYIRSVIRVTLGLELPYIRSVIRVD